MKHPLAGAPDHLSEEQKAIWEELAFAVPREILEPQHRLGFENLVRVVAFYRRYPEAPDRKSRARDARAWLADWGVKPRDRQRVLEGKR